MARGGKRAGNKPYVYTKPTVTKSDDQSALAKGWGYLTEPFTGNIQARNIRDATNKQVEAGREGIAEQRRQYDLSRADMMPWMQAGQRSLGTLEGMMNSGEFEMAPEEFNASQYKMPGEFSFGVDDYMESPYAKFLQQEGQRGIERSAAARGGLASGNTLAGLQNRAMQISSGDYADQYNRAADAYTTNYNRAGAERNFGYGNFLDSYNRRAGQKTDKYNRLAGLSGVGQMQSSALGNMGQNYGNQYAQGMQGIGNAQAGGIMGQSNARTQGSQNLWNLGGQTAMMYATGGMGGAKPSPYSVNPYARVNNMGVA